MKCSRRNFVASLATLRRTNPSADCVTAFLLRLSFFFSAIGRGRGAVEQRTEVALIRQWKKCVSIADGINAAVLVLQLNHFVSESYFMQARCCA